MKSTKKLDEQPDELLDDIEEEEQLGIMARFLNGSGFGFMVAVVLCFIVLGLVAKPVWKKLSSVTESIPTTVVHEEPSAVDIFAVSYAMYGESPGITKYLNVSIENDKSNLQTVEIRLETDGGKVISETKRLEPAASIKILQMLDTYTPVVGETNVILVYRIYFESDYAEVRCPFIISVEEKLE